METKQYTTMFNQLIDDNDLIEMTHNQLFECITNRWDDNLELFIQEFGADLTTVLSTFTFSLDAVAVNRKYYKEESLDFITVSFQIIDSNASTIGVYTALYNFDMESFDDELIIA